MKALIIFIVQNYFGELSCEFVKVQT